MGPNRLVVVRPTRTKTKSKQAGSLIGVPLVVQLREQGQSSEGMVHEQLRLKLFDLWPLTASAEVDWISRDGGFHYTSQCDCIHPELCTAGENTMGGPDACDVRRQQTPVTRAVLRGMWAFVCGG